MFEGDHPRVTALLVRWRDGDDAAAQELMPLVHHEMKRIAHRQMAGERRGHVLQTTALVNEAYVRLVGVRHVRWRDRAHFLALTTRVMRRVLVDFARARKNQKRGGAFDRVAFDESVAARCETPEAVIAVDAALDALSGQHRRKGQVVELRFFGGLSVEETAEALGVSQETVLRDWRFAKSWLLRELSGRAARGGST
jgi:RNA polymerase sigma factor (TIGR02999 family)